MILKEETGTSICPQSNNNVVIGSLQLFYMYCRILHLSAIIYINKLDKYECMQLNDSIYNYIHICDTIA